MKQPIEILDAIHQSSACVHVSIDDSILGLQEAFQGGYQSPFQADYFRYLKELHEATGVAITNYLFFSTNGLFEALYDYDHNRLRSEQIPPYFDLSMVDDRFQDEFRRAGAWLRWNFHCLDFSTPVNVQTIQEVRMAIDTVRSCVRTFAGVECAHTWRPHFYTGGADACALMKERGTRILLTPDEFQKSAANLRPEMVRRMRTAKKVVEDPDAGFFLLRSLFRLEETSLAKAEVMLCEHIDAGGVAAFFTHEQKMMRNIYPQANELQTRFRSLLEFIHRRGWAFSI